MINWLEVAIVGQVFLLIIGWSRIYFQSPTHIILGWLARILPGSFIGITIFEWAFVRTGKLSARVYYHEHRHVLQCRAVGYVIYYPLYVLAYIATIFTGSLKYRANWFEKDARRYADRKIAKMIVSSPVL